MFEIVDNGVGMSKEQLELVQRNEKRGGKEHLTGIGINNVDGRLKLLYGDKFGVKIQSQEGKGTKAVVLMPANTQI